MTRRLLAIAGLTGLAVAQPLLDLLGNSPATFQINRIEGYGIVVFAIAIVVIPPAVLWIAGEGARQVYRPSGPIVHTVTIGLLCAMVGTLLAKEASDLTLLNAAIGLAAGVLGAVAYRRYEPVGMWIRLLSIANLFFLFQFVVLAPVSGWIDSGTSTAVAQNVERVDPRSEPGNDAGGEAASEQSELHSVVMIVLDEWPTQSVLADDGLVDPVRFPNLAAFAQDATWYRHFSVASPFTQSAVPALLDGLDPHGEPTWVDHPDNLFSLLAASHHLVASESLTRLCGFDSCGVQPVPPPAADDDPEPDRAKVPHEDAVGEPEAATLDSDPRWGNLAGTAWDIWKARVGPSRPPPVESFDDFQEDLSAVAPAPTANTTSIPVPASTEPAPTEPTPTEPASEEDVELDRFLATLVGTQPARHLAFLDALRPTDEPFFGYLHLILPHQPWTLREDGTTYEVAAGRTDYEADNQDPWPVLVGQQRHLLQAEYADRLLGLTMSRLQEIDEYDDALIVVVGDHGIGFGAGEPSRRVTEGNLAEVAYAPLFIKAPGSGEGTVDDSNLNSTDLTPTVADMLGLDLPWETDGHPAGSPEIEARGDEKYIYNFTDAFDYTFLGIVEYDDETEFEALVDQRFPGIGPDDDRLAGLYRDVAGRELIGREAGPTFGPVDGRASIAELGRLREPGTDRPLLAEVAGRVADPPTEATVVVAVNDRIVGVSPLYRRDGRDGSFVVLLPADALASSANTVRVGVRTPDGTVTELTIDEG